MLLLKRDSRAKRTLSKIEQITKVILPYLKFIAIAIVFLGYIGILCIFGFVVVLGLCLGTWALPLAETVVFILMIFVGIVGYIGLSLEK